MIVILFFDFFLGSKSGISGIFGTFLADIGGFFLNELTSHFMSNLLFSFVFLQSIWPTRDEFCTRYPFVSLFFYFEIFGRFGTFLAHIGVFFLNHLPNRFGSNFSFSSSFFLRPLSFFVDFFIGSNNEILGSFGTFLAHYWRIFSERLAKWQ